MRAQLQSLDGHKHQVVLLTDSITVGRRKGAIRVSGSTVSRQLARIFEEGGRYWFEDLGGDGVWVNGAKVEGAASLTNRDKLQVGSLQMDCFEG